jgi:acetyl esterase/lipase
VRLITIFDKLKIQRPEIIKVLEKQDKLRSQAASLFFSKEENRDIDFTSLWAKVMDANIRWFNGEDVRGLLTIKEMRFLARLHRNAVEFRSNKIQKQSSFMTDVKIVSVNLDGVPAEWQIAPGVSKDKVILYFHGGGYIMGSPNFTRLISVRLGIALKARILSIDYRLAPEHPYPKGIEDCISSYKWLLSNNFDPKNIVIAGDSAGGYFSLITLVKLRNEGIPLPAGAILFSPATDLALTGETIITNAPTDPILADLGIFWWNECYLSGADPFSGEVSPLFAALTGLPPLLIQVSTSEMLYDDARRFVKEAKKAGVEVILQTWDDTLHEFQIYDLSESTEAFDKAREFTEKLFEF